MTELPPSEDDAYGEQVEHYINEDRGIMLILYNHELGISKEWPDADYNTWFRTVLFLIVQSPFVVVTVLAVFLIVFFEVQYRCSQFKKQRRLRATLEQALRTPITHVTPNRRQIPPMKRSARKLLIKTKDGCVRVMVADHVSDQQFLIENVQLIQKEPNLRRSRSSD